MWPFFYVSLNFWFVKKQEEILIHVDIKEGRGVLKVLKIWDIYSVYVADQSHTWIGDPPKYM